MASRDYRYDDEGGTPCACERHCAERDYQGNPGLGPRAFCATDEDRIRDAIAGLPKTYAELRLLLPVTGQQEERVTGSREAPVPVNQIGRASCRERV